MAGGRVRGTNGGAGASVAGLTADLTHGLSAKIDYAGDVRSSFVASTLSGTLRMKF